MSIRTTKRRQVLVVQCGQSRILAAYAGGRRPYESDDPDRLVFDVTRHPLEPWRYPGSIQAMYLLGRDLRALGPDDEPVSFPALPCPNHSNGHRIDADRLAEEIDNQPPSRSMRVSVSRVEATSR